MPHTAALELASCKVTSLSSMSQEPLLKRETLQLPERERDTKEMLSMVFGLTRFHTVTVYYDHKLLAAVLK